MTAPLVGITGALRRWDGGDRVGVNAPHVRAVLAAGGTPLVIPPLLSPAAADAVMAALDALLFTGGEDVDPARYGAAPSPRLGAVSAERDATEFALFAAARRLGLPVLGICRGAQVVNVAMGGTLWQDLPSERPGPIDHDPNRPRDARTHAIRLAPGSRTARALGTERHPVNSIHHQAVRDVAPGLVATAWADDGVIEAMEGTDGAWLVAVQWHPEELDGEGLPDRGLFRALVAEAAGRRQPAPPPAPPATLSGRRGPAAPARSRSGSERRRGR